MLELKNLDVAYGRVQALHDVSLSVAGDEAVAVLGANGAGKSTLIKTAIGWQEPQRGSVHFDNQDVTWLTPWERVERGMALVPEGGRVFRGLTVQENLRLGAYRQADEQAVGSQMETVFELFPALAERRRQVAHTLSGGEQQMLAIGRAMMSDPRLLLIDEISMGLMPILVQRVFETINDLRQQGVAILLVEQNAYEALNVVDRAYVLENGRLVLEGTPDELREDQRVKAAYLGG
ncbi:MAG: High-affinity branched-chain amino acid transport ATP-binding protein LivF [Anaerolineales bacterium]|nr:High-affinity branched-chain amino acid transport ATP-binding protein LivF [Anaerolineales bacterium]